MGKFLIKFLHRTSVNSITFAAIIMAGSGIVSRILGFVRDRILAAQFGAGDVLDVYYAAFRLPDLIFDLLILGALTAAFIPLFTGLMAKDKFHDAWRLAGGVFIILSSAMGLMVTVLFFATPYLVPLIVPGFEMQKMEMTVVFTRVMLLSPFFLGMSALFGGVLMSLKRFFIYALAPIFYNIGIIIGALFFVPQMGAIGLAWGVVLGAVLHFSITMPSAVACGFGQQVIGLYAAWKDAAVRKVLILMLPRVLGTASQQISLLAVTFFASLTVAGSLTAFTFAHNIGSIPIGIIGIPFAIAAFPTLSTYFAKGDSDAFANLLIKYVRRTMFLVLPLVMITITLRAQIVRVVLGSGNFDWMDTIMTFQILGILAISVFALALIPLLARSFYAMHNTITPVVVGIISVVANIVTVMMLLPTYDVYAIAIGFAFGAFVNFVLLFILLEQHLQHNALTHLHNAVLGSIFAMGVATGAVFGLLRLESLVIGDLSAVTLVGFSAVWLAIFTFTSTVLRIEVFYTRVFSMTIIAGISVQVTKFVIGTVTDLSTFGEVFAQLVFAGGIGMGTYFFLAYILHVDEFFVLRARMIRFILRRNLQ